MVLTFLNPHFVGGDSWKNFDLRINKLRFLDQAYLALELWSEILQQRRRTINYLKKKEKTSTASSVALSEDLIDLIKTDTFGRLDEQTKLDP